MKKSLGPKTYIYPHPVLIVGTYDKNGKPNLANVAWGGICCSQPPAVAISLRKATYSYENIKKNEAFTVNVLSSQDIVKADFYGMVSGKDTNKFEVTNITPVKSELINAPYGKEFPLILECKLINTIEIGTHTQFIGEILDVKADENVLAENGRMDITKVKPALYGHADRKYYAVGEELGKAFTIGKEFI